MAGRKLIGFEALARWNHPKRGLVTPDKFIPVAEDCGLINILGEWALRQACRQAVEWPGELKVAVNLSPAQFASPNLRHVVRTVLDETGLAARRLELEITEGLLMRNTEKTLETLHQLKLLGVRIAMDDFGTLSVASYLQSPVRQDQGDRFRHDAAHRAAIQDHRPPVIEIAASLGMTTTAEGRSRRNARSSGATRGAGPRFGRPHRGGLPLP
jgi:EAL domain-containing protein (putative c-di-GMP-specific phosphodiesterase class I)